MLDLEGDFTKTPRILEEVAELAARAEEAKNIAKHNLDIAVAEASDRIRQPWLAQGAAQTRIDSDLRILVPLAPEVRAAREDYTATIRDADLCAGLFTTIKDQSRLLGKAADMLCSGYINPATLNDQRRAEIRRATNAQERVRRPQS